MADLDLSKPVQTRGGRMVEIQPRDLAGDWPVMGIVTEPDGSELVRQWRADGLFAEGVESDDDLVNIEQARWINLYEPNSHLAYPAHHWWLSRAAADESAARIRLTVGPRIAVIELTAAGEFIVTKVEK